MAQDREDSAEMQDQQAVAVAKAQMWRVRGEQARAQGRTADADRCDDKARDWASKAKQIEQLARS